MRPVGGGAMRALLAGETVHILRPEFDYSTGDAVATWSRERVDGVLVGPASTSGIADAMRPEGTRTVYRLAFPKGYSRSLRGCRVEISGEVFEVRGDPRPVRRRLLSRWSMEAEAVRCDG